MGKFKVGDRVKVVKTVRGATKVEIGSVGVIKAILKHLDNLNMVGIYHTCRGNCKDDHGYFCHEEMLELVERKRQPIVIYRKGNQVIALDKETGERGFAVCSPADTFDFKVGAKLAFERLMTPTPEPAPQRLNTKICVVKTTGYYHYLTVGKIYEIIDGYFFNDMGSKFPLFKPLNTIDDLRSYMSPSAERGDKEGFTKYGIEFVEVVE